MYFSRGKICAAVFIPYRSQLTVLNTPTNIFYTCLKKNFKSPEEELSSSFKNLHHHCSERFVLKTGFIAQGQK